MAGIGEEPDDPIRAPAAHGVDMRRRDQLGHVAPGGADEAALASPRLVGARLLRIVDDARPGVDRVAEPGACLAEHLHQHASDVGVLRPDGRVHVPGEGGPSRAAARLVVRHVRAVRRVIHLLRLPGDEPVLDVDSPGAGPGAVDAVGRPHHAIVLPAPPVRRLPRPRVGRVLAPVLRRALPGAKELPGPQQRHAPPSGGHACNLTHMGPGFRA
jgi:hypothetical protein